MIRVGVTGRGLFPSTDAEGYVFFGARANLIAARVAYINRHGARFLFDNTPPPVPGYPRLRRGEIVVGERA
jgi:hypothetical protein